MDSANGGEVKPNGSETANGGEVKQRNIGVQTSETALDARNSDDENKYSPKTTYTELEKILYGMTKQPFLVFVCEWIERQTSFKHSFSIIAVSLALYLIFGDGAGMVSLFLSGVCPAYASAVYLCQPRTDVRKSIMWFAYFFPLFLCWPLEMALGSSTLYSLYVYFLIKTVVFLFFLYPETRASQILYDKITGPAISYVRALGEQSVTE